MSQRRSFNSRCVAEQIYFPEGLSSRPADPACLLRRKPIGRKEFIDQCRSGPAFFSFNTGMWISSPFCPAVSSFAGRWLPGRGIRSPGNGLGCPPDCQRGRIGLLHQRQNPMPEEISGIFIRFIGAVLYPGQLGIHRQTAAILPGRQKATDARSSLAGAACREARSDPVPLKKFMTIVSILSSS